MRYTGPKARLCRRAGVNLYGTPKYHKIMDQKPGLPGMHGAKRQPKSSEYASQLKAKQTMKLMYGLTEKQFRKYFDEAQRSSQVTGDALCQLLERRLDNVIYRSGFAKTRAQARQMVSHGLWLVNDRRVTVPSIIVGIDDVLSIKPSKQKSVIWNGIKEELDNQYIIPSWLTVSWTKHSITINALPDARHFEAVVEPRIIIEFYSR